MSITLRIRDVMDRKVVAIDAGAKVADAIREMLKADVWSLLVQRRGLPEGVVTERDVIRRCVGKGLSPEKMQVEKIMTSPLVTIGSDATIREAMNLMVEKDIRRLFVVENGKVVGRVTQTELFASTLEVMSSLSSLSGQL